jgi:hypothetical protein
MTTLPLADGARMLGIHPKTLHHWLTQAQMPSYPHPSDARLKCLTLQHLQQLATMHARPLQFSAVAEPVLSEGVLAHASSERQALLPETDPLPTSLVPEADLIQKLSHLEMQVATLQQHLAGLALELLQERTQHYEQRLQTLEARLGLPPQQDRLISALQSAREQRSQPDTPLNTRRVHPAKGRPRAILPLIEYVADGTYIVICPELGELALTPDSPAWFTWLETISSLRFLGQHGRWSAYRDKRRASHGWFAYRRINGHQYVHALGSPHELTIARFEQMAATLQSYVTTS